MNIRITYNFYDIFLNFILSSSTVLVYTIWIVKLVDLTKKIQKYNIRTLLNCIIVSWASLNCYEVWACAITLQTSVTDNLNRACLCFPVIKKFGFWIFILEITSDLLYNVIAMFFLEIIYIDHSHIDKLIWIWFWKAILFPW